MALMIIDSKNLIDIADAIRNKLSSTDTYKPQEMSDAIMQIVSGGGSEIEFAVYTYVGDANVPLEDL